MIPSAELDLAWSAVEGEAVYLDWSHESAYYRSEFQKIRASGETYRGAFNWPAFLFGAFWCLARNLEWHGIVWLGLALVTGGWITPLLLAYNVYLGFRANYIRYARVAKGRLVLLGD